MGSDIQLFKWREEKKLVLLEVSIGDFNARIGNERRATVIDKDTLGN